MLDRLSRLAGHWAVLGGLVLIAIILVTSLNIALFGADRIAGLWGTDVAGLSGYEDFVRLAISSTGWPGGVRERTSRKNGPSGQASKTRCAR